MLGAMDEEEKSGSSPQRFQSNASQVVDKNDRTNMNRSAANSSMASSSIRSSNSSQFSSVQGRSSPKSQSMVSGNSAEEEDEVGEES